MGKTVRIMMVCAASLLAISEAEAQELRLLNGVVIRGEARRATNEGLEVLTPQGPRVYAWNTLSPATRYRYQPQYRANLKEILEGKPVSARTNAPDAAYNPFASSDAGK